MLKLIKPTFGVGDVLDMCAPGAYVNDIKAARPALLDSESKYTSEVAASNVWTFEARQPGVTDAVAERVSWAYDNRLQSKRGDARLVYDELRLGAPDGVCPNCMARDAGALDHYLPRETHPGLALHPSNLVPICTQCNTTKSSKIALSAEEQFLHPYFDDLGPSDWLRADVQPVPSSPLTFSVVQPHRWDDLLYERVKKHFERYGLVELYASKSSALLGNHRHAFEVESTQAPDGSKPGAVQALARTMATSYAKNATHPWAATAFSTWSASAWFCNGGWRIAEVPSGLRSA